MEGLLMQKELDKLNMRSRFMGYLMENMNGRVVDANIIELKGDKI